MQGRTLCELARQAGLTSSAIARHLGLTRQQVHRWAHGVRPLPERLRTELTVVVMQAVRLRVGEQRPERLLALAGECLLAEREAMGEGSTATRHILLNALDHCKPLNPEECRKPANAEKLCHLATSLMEHAALLRRIGPVLECVREGSGANE